MDCLGIGDTWCLSCWGWMSVNIGCLSVIYFKLCTSKKNYDFSIGCTTFNTTHWQLQPHTEQGSLLATLLSCRHKLVKSWHKNLRRSDGYMESDDSVVFTSFPSLKAKSLTASWRWLATVISYQRWHNNSDHLRPMFPPHKKDASPFFMTLWILCFMQFWGLNVVGTLLVSF